MDSLIASQTVRLGKLLRTLIEYRQDLALIPTNHPVRIRHKNQWQVLKEHPVLSSEALHAAIRGSFGEAVSHALDTKHKTFFEHHGHRFFLHFLKDHTGGLLFIERLHPLPEPSTWPKAIQNWLKDGGFLEVENEALYAAILQEWTRENTGIAISLEHSIKYPVPSSKALLKQREWKTDFDSLEKSLNEALALKPQLLAVNRLPFTEEEKEKLKKLANTISILICQNSALAF